MRQPILLVTRQRLFDIVRVSAILCLLVAGAGCGGADCGWGSQVSAWEDVNENGVIDSGELPLSDVKIFFNSVGSPSDYQRGPFATDSKGETRLSEFMPGCPSRSFEVYPEVPVGYRLTTPARQTSNGPGFRDALAFGFASLPGSGVTPAKQAALTCTSHKLLDADEDQFLLDVQVGPDGSVWAALFGKGAAQYVPEQKRWLTYSQSDGLAGNEVRRITITTDGAVWFATTTGASRFDGKAWLSLTTANGLVNDNVRKVAQATDGSLWFSTRAGVSQYMPAQNRWQNFTSRDGLAYDFTTNVAITSDGSVWFPSVGKGISRLMPGLTPTWRIYTQNPTGERHPKVDTIDDIKVDRAGDLWIGSMGGVLHYKPHADRWTNIFFPATSVGSFAKAVAVAGDGSLWIGTEASPPQLYHVTGVGVNEERQWVRYDSRDGLPTSALAGESQDFIRALSIAPDGALWVGTAGYATRCELRE
ncbi:MAG: hypothetical protein HZB53_22755 [Chloroflexi bacterium]|nr:hypothetical protein [Chloroflexota bacterium]